MKLNEDFFDENTITQTDDEIEDIKQPYKHRLEFTHKVQPPHTLTEFPSVIKFLIAKYNILLNRSKHIARHSQPEIYIFKTSNNADSIRLTIECDIIPFNDIHSLFNFLDKLTLETFEISSTGTNVYSVINSIHNNELMICQYFPSQFSFRHIQNYPRLLKELLIGYDRETYIPQEY